MYFSNIIDRGVGFFRLFCILYFGLIFYFLKLDLIIWFMEEFGKF